MDRGEVLQEVPRLILLTVHVMTMKPWNHPQPKGSDSSFALHGLS